MNTIQVFNNDTTLIQQASNYILSALQQAVSLKGSATLVLSGGNTPLKLYQYWAENHAADDFWQHVSFYWGDERCVALNSNENNAYNALPYLSKLNIKQKNIYRIESEQKPQIAAQNYYHTIQKNMGMHPYFDVVMLGMGADGHFASIFPQSELISSNDVNVKSVYVPQLQKDRITFTKALVESTHAVFYLISGEDKAATLQQVLYGTHNPMLYPSQLLAQDYKGTVLWYVDAAAAAQLPKN